MTNFNMFVLVLYYFVGFCYIVNCRISDFRKCANEDCSVPISLATTLMRYAADDERIISFKPNEKATVYSKEAGDRPDLWEVEINGKRGYVPKNFLREKKVLVNRSAVNKLVSTGRDINLKENSTQEVYKEENIESSTPKLPSTSKGIFSMVGGVSADSVPPNSPDINPHASSSYEVFSGTTIYSDGTVSVDPQNKAPTDSVENTIKDSENQKQSESISSIHETSNDEEKLSGNESTEHISETDSSKHSVTPDKEKQPSMPAESPKKTNENILVDTESDKNKRKESDVKETDDKLSESIELDKNTQRPQEEIYSTLSSESVRETQEDILTDTHTEKDTQEPVITSTEAQGIIGGLMNSITHYMSSGSGGGENEEVYDKEDVENGDQSNLVGEEMDDNTDDEEGEEELEETLNISDKTNIRYNTESNEGPDFQVNHLNHGKVNNLETINESNEKNIDESNTMADIKNVSDKNTDSNDPSITEFSTDKPTTNNPSMDMEDDKIGTEKTTNAMTESPNVKPKEKMSSISKDSIVAEHSSDKSIEIKAGKGTGSNGLNSEAAIISTLNNTVKNEISVSYHGHPLSNTAAKEADQINNITTTDHQNNVDQEAIQNVLKDNEISDQESTEITTGSVGRVSNDLKPDEQNGTTPPSENVETSPDVPLENSGKTGSVVRVSHDLKLDEQNGTAPLSENVETSPDVPIENSDETGSVDRVSNDLKPDEQNGTNPLSQNVETSPDVPLENSDETGFLDRVSNDLKPDEQNGTTPLSENFETSPDVPLKNSGKTGSVGGVSNDLKPNEQNGITQLSENVETSPDLPLENSGKSGSVGRVSNDLKPDEQNGTTPLSENVETSPDVLPENSDTLETISDHNKKSVLNMFPPVVNPVQSIDEELSNAELVSPLQTHDHGAFSPPVVPENSPEQPFQLSNELPPSPVLENSNIVDVDGQDNTSKDQNTITPEIDQLKSISEELEVIGFVNTPREERSIHVVPEGEEQQTEVKDTVAADYVTGDDNINNEISTSWFEPLFNLFSFSDSTEQHIEKPMSEGSVVMSESPSSVSFSYSKDETCAADGPEGSCETLTQPSESWQESLYASDISGAMELLEKVPLDVTIWLIITAVVVLIFSLGYYYIEAHKRDGHLVAIINKLEREVLVLKKETCILDDRLQTSHDQLEAWNTNSSENDALIVDLKEELEETKAIKAELEEQLAALEREVETVTESGLEMHRLLSESLSSQDGSQVLLSTVESLREKLENQEIEISSLNQKLSQKNREVEELGEELTKSSEVVSSFEEKILTITREKEEEALELKDKHRKLIAQLEEVMETKALDETRVSTEVSKLRLFIEELQKTVAEKDLELEELKEVVKEVRSTDSNEKMDALFDVVSVRALLKSASTERDDFKERFQEEEGARKLLEGHMKKIAQEVAELKNSYETAEKEKIEALTKLQVLSNYFKEKESQLQKELGLQESMWLQKQSNDHTIYEQMRSLREENEKYKLQNESLKKEIVDQESSFKIQVANVEQKAHENWVASRQAERRLKEVQQEAAQLRNRLTVEKNTANFSLDEGKHNISESNGDPSSSPPSMLFPSTRSPPFMMYPPMHPPGDFVPPPPLIGSPYPSEGRPPPLGRISSPPLDHRFSPPPPLSYPTYDYQPYGHHSPSPPPPMPPHPHHRTVHKPQPREMPRDPKDLTLSNYSPESDKTTRRNKR